MIFCYRLLVNLFYLFSISGVFSFKSTSFTSVLPSIHFNLILTSEIKVTILLMDFEGIGDL